MITLASTFAAAPSTERGTFTILRSHDEAGVLTYVNRKNAIWRSVENPAISDSYGDHAGANITSASWAPNGNWIATGDERGILKIWAPKHESRVVKLEVNALGGKIIDIDWSPDSQRVVTVGEGREVYGKVMMWDTGNGVGTINAHTKKLNSCSFKSSRPFRIVTASDDMQANLYSGPPFAFTTSIRDFTNFVNCVRYSPDGNYFAAASSDKSVSLYDGKEGTLIHRFGDAHAGSVYQLAWSSDSKQFVTASGDKSLKVWDVDSKACISTLTAGTDVDCMMVGVTWYRQTIVGLALSGDLFYFHVADGPFKVVSGHQQSIASFALDSSTGVLYSSDTFGRVCAWSLTEGSLGRLAYSGKLKLESKITGLCVSKGQVVAAAEKIASWNTSDHKPSADVQKLDRNAVGATALPLSDLVLVASTNAVTAFNSQLHNTGSTSFGFDLGCITSLPDETRVFIGTSDGRLLSHRVTTNGLGEQVAELRLAQSHIRITCLAVSPDARYLAAGDSNREVHVIDLAEMKSLDLNWVFHSSSVSSVSWSPDSTRLVSGSSDSHLIVWSLATPTKRAKFENAHRGGVTATNFVSDSSFVSGGEDGAVRVWTV